MRPQISVTVRVQDECATPWREPTEHDAVERQSGTQAALSHGFDDRGSNRGPAPGAGPVRSDGMPLTLRAFAPELSRAEQG